IGVLGEETVAGMDRLRARGLSCFDNFLADEIALACRTRPDMHRLVRHAPVQRLRVGVRKNGDSPDAELPRGANDAAGNLAPVGNEKGLHHPSDYILNTPN